MVNYAQAGFNTCLVFGLCDVCMESYGKTQFVIKLVGSYWGSSIKFVLACFEVLEHPLSF